MRPSLLHSTPGAHGVAIAVLRIACGILFFLHGWQKVFGFGLTGVAGAFTKMGIPAASLMGPFVALLELLGGAALVLGLLTRPVAFVLAVEMLGAIALVHLANGFFLPTGFEFAFVLLAAMLAIAIGGPGAYALDDRLARDRHTAADGIG